jgi:hypothetical protein
MLNRFVAANDLKDGTKVSVEGNAFRNFIMPKKVEIDGKAIDLVAAATRPMRNFEPGQARERRELTPGENRGPGKNMVPPGRNMVPPRHQFNPGQKAPNPNPRVRNRVSESS